MSAEVVSPQDLRDAVGNVLSLVRAEGATFRAEIVGMLDRQADNHANAVGRLADQFKQQNGRVNALETEQDNRYQALGEIVRGITAAMDQAKLTEARKAGYTEGLGTVAISRRQLAVGLAVIVAIGPILTGIAKFWLGW